jgi:transposase
MPLYRQAKQLYRAGVPVARSTLTDLFHRAAGLLRPLVTRAEQLVAQSELVQADETTFRIIEPIKCRKGYIWTFIGAGLIVYRFAPSRSGETPQRVLGGSSGKLLVDGYTGYNEVCEVDGRLRVGCLAHCRRKFFEAHSTAPDEARHALDTILELYANEHEAEDLNIVGTAEHLQLRQSKSTPVMDGFHDWLLEQKPLHVPKSPMAKAVGYALNQWDHLTMFLDDAALPLDNNEAERRLRLVALGRKNYLFAADDDGAENLATLMSLVVTCEAHDINPEEYLADVLLRIQVHPNSRIDELLPPMWQHLRETGELAPLEAATN